MSFDGIYLRIVYIYELKFQTIPIIVSRKITYYRPPSAECASATSQRLVASTAVSNVFDNTRLCRESIGKRSEVRLFIVF